MANLNIFVIKGPTELSEAAYQKIKPILNTAEVQEVLSRVLADIILVLGGDGTVMHAARKDLKVLSEDRQPIFGIKAGNPRSKGMLLNDINLDADLDKVIEIIKNSHASKLHYLKILAQSVSGKVKEFYGFNDVSTLRKEAQSAATQISINEKIGMDRCMGDGIIMATPQGSTAYNLSAGGTVASSMDSIVLTGNNSNMGSIVLPKQSEILLEVLESEKRPQKLESDGRLILENLEWVQVTTSNQFSILRFALDHKFEDKLIAEALR